MSKTCVDCAEDLPLSRRLLGKDRCETCEAKHDAELEVERKRKVAEFDRAVDEYSEVTAQLRQEAPVGTALARIRAAMDITPLAPEEVKRLNNQAFEVYLDQVLADEVVSPEEDRAVFKAVKELGIEPGAAKLHEWSVAEAASGLLPRDPHPEIVLNRDEVAFCKAPANLLAKKEVKELRFDHQSVSIPVGHTGVRYRIGQGRGRTVVVGTRVETEDRGTLSITSERIVFTGAEKSFEFPHNRLLGIRLFTDGLGLQIANRQSVPTLHTGDKVCEYLAAVALSAAAISRGSFALPVEQSQPRQATTPPLPKLLEVADYKDPPAGE